MEWSKEDVLLLVDLVRRRPCLYDKECEAYQNTKLKQDVFRELATIISSTRPETTVQDVSEKWEALCSMYTSICKKGTAKKVKKPQSKPFFFEKMGFMRPHLGLPIKNPVLKINLNGNNKDITNEEATENNGRLSQNKERFPCLELARVESSHDVVSDEEIDSVDATNGGSVSAISIDSENSPLVNMLPPQLNSSRKRRHSTMSIMSQATRNDISCVTIGSPLVNVNDSILDRTEPFVSEYQSYRKSNGSFASKDTYAPDEDEDHYYMKYILCKVKKLEGAQKLNFKLQLERLLYECTKQ